MATKLHLSRKKEGVRKIKFLDLIFPIHCEVCGELSDTSFCNSCRKEIVYDPLGRALTLYLGVMKQAVKSFKFAKRRALGDIFVKMMLEKAPLDCDLVVPVPTSLTKKAYHPSEILAKSLASSLKLPLNTHSLFLLKEKISQIGLLRSERFENVKGVFEVREKEFISGKSVILVDDIMTTGATVKECLAKLHEAGAEKVVTLVLSRAISMLK